MLYAMDRLSNIPLLWSCENFMEPAGYKHFVPLGLSHWMRNPHDDFGCVSGFLFDTR
jgi:hypothetical protein